MAPRVEVPMNFGLELLGSPSHGNLTLELAPGLDPVKVNTAIMSFNSPVIYNLTTELSQNSIGVEEFSSEAVQCFSRACYSGELLEVDMTFFRHLFKMAIVFKIRWLESRCVDLFEEFVNEVTPKEYKFEDFLVFYKDAEFASTVLKHEKLIEIVLKSFAEFPHKKRAFVRDYTYEIYSISEKNLKLLVNVVGKDKDMLVNTLIQ